MSYGILNSLGSHQSSQYNTLSQAAGLEQQRKNLRTQAKAQIKQDQKNSIMGGAGTGAALGFMVGGPLGAAAGGVIGAVGGALMDAIF